MSAILKHPDVRRGRMVPTQREAMPDQRRASGVALLAVLNASLHQRIVHETLDPEEN